VSPPEKSWKDLLLSSGVPLEHSVEQVLRRLEFHNPREHKYVRADETGAPTVFSVDVRAPRIYADRGLWLDLLIECKYRHPGTRWVFAPQEYDDFLFGPFLRDSFIFLDQTDISRQFEAGVFDKFSDKYPLCKRGIELLPKESNPKTIKQAVEQLRYGVVDRIAEALAYQLSTGERDTRNPLFLLVPIIVTTAELWRMRDDVRIDTIQQAGELSEVAEQFDVLVYREPPDNLAARYAVERIDRELSDKRRENFDRLLKATGHHGYTFFQSWLPSHAPSQFVVIRQPRFEEAMRNLVKFIDRPDLIVPRKPADVPPP
jgi:hypothetical protein